MDLAVNLYLQDADFTLWQGDASTVLTELALMGTKVDCVITSPPYYGLRDYGTGEWAGGNPECTHEMAKKKTRYDYSLATSPIQNASRKGTDAQPALFRDVCPGCGARRVDDQVGLEETPDAYIERLRDVLAAAFNVLADHGTLWLNLGDSYLDKRLALVPHRVALALVEAGWHLRNAVTWCKPNVMPESATDRFTRATEMLFLFSKKPKYFFKQLFEPVSIDRDKHHVSGGPHSLQHRDGDRWPNEEGRNMRDWWVIPTGQLPEAHFAAFPEELVRRCITAGCKPGGTVLDPFMGSGTTALVARKLGYRSMGIELNPLYCELIARRTGQLSLMATEEVA